MARMGFSGSGGGGGGGGESNIVNLIHPCAFLHAPSKFPTWGSMLDRIQAFDASAGNSICTVFGASL